MECIQDSTIDLRIDKIDININTLVIIAGSEKREGGTTKPRNETDNLKIYCDLRSFLQKKDLQAFQSRRKIKKEGF
jgi:hypothetical protein